MTASTRRRVPLCPGSAVGASAAGGAMGALPPSDGDPAGAVPVRGGRSAGALPPSGDGSAGPVSVRGGGSVVIPAHP
ncbi:hypothetical protein ACFQV8_03900 [Pseudonocardia benzenivorans]